MATIAGVATMLAVPAGASAQADSYACHAQASGDVSEATGVFGFLWTSASVACVMGDLNGGSGGDPEQSSGVFTSAADGLMYSVSFTGLPDPTDCDVLTTSIFGGQMSWDSESGIPVGAGEHEWLTFNATLVGGVGPMTVSGGFSGAGTMTLACFGDDFDATFTFAMAN